MTDRPASGRDAATGTPRRGAPVAALVGLGLYALVVVAFAYVSLESPIVTPLWPILLLTVGGLATIVLGIRRPTWAFAAALGLTLLSVAWGTVAEAVLVLIALSRVGVRRRARVAWGWFGITVVTIAASGALFALRMQVGPPLWGLQGGPEYHDPFTDWLNVTVVTAVIGLVVTLIGVDIGHRRRYRAALVERAEQMRRERDQQATIATARERERIAREMHDVIAHSLAVMVAMADGAHAVADRDPAESKEAVRRIASTGRRTLDEVRRLLGSVRGDDAAVGDRSTRAADGGEEPPQPSAAQLPTLVSEFRAAGLPVRLERHGALAEDAAVGLTVYRIVQESLTNVLRHASGVRDVLVRVGVADGTVDILVEDSSNPAAPSSDPGRGLVGIRERTALYDGIAETGPRDGGGWRVHVRLPIWRDDHA